MAHSSLQHRRTHNLLLISKLLNQRDAASPCTLVLDSLEQSGTPLLAEYMRRAAASKVHIVFVSFETLHKPKYAHTLIKAWDQPLPSWQKEVIAHLKSEPSQRKLLVFDSLNQLSASQTTNVPGLLSSFISATSSLLALYHTDIPLPVSKNPHQDAYSPSALTLLRYLATTIFNTHSLHHVLAQKDARSRSHAEPIFGLELGVEGVLQSLGANGQEGLVLEMEHRRKSGRGVREWYFMPLSNSSSAQGRSREVVTLLEDHPDYRTSEEKAATATEEAVDTTFELGLTEKQRRDRDGVVLPYYDAQNGGGDGGRIVYDMGEEDDFDEEEDEI